MCCAGGRLGTDPPGGHGLVLHVGYGWEGMKADLLKHGSVHRVVHDARCIWVDNWQVFPGTYSLHSRQARDPLPNAAVPSHAPQAAEAPSAARPALPWQVLAGPQEEAAAGEGGLGPGEEQGDGGRVVERYEMAEQQGEDGSRVTGGYGASSGQWASRLRQGAHAGWPIGLRGLLLRSRA